MLCGNPFQVPELTDYCLDFLHESKPDLKTCTAVCRGWLPTARFHLFSALNFSGPLGNRDLRISHLVGISGSPHILALVSRLTIDVYYLEESNSFSAAIPQLKQLEEIYISGDLRPSTSTLHTALVAARAILGLPTVQNVELYSSFQSPDAFLYIWNGCAESIRHLTLGTKTPTYDWASSPVLDMRRKIPLESLSLMYPHSVTSWLATTACPFDFSRLTTLSVQEHVIILGWPQFAGVHLTLQRLEFWAASRTPLDLGLFARLQHLRILLVQGGPSLEMALTALSTLPGGNRLASLEIGYLSPLPGSLGRLDDLLFSMALPALAEVTVATNIASRHINVEKAMPKLLSRGLLSVIYR
ncbi:hypothetical protein C8F04DRAFT_1237087 [Mycena alexandri]|uniref:F-box domain-containing protein n=1 Tax=Mycena alexandri TaxID=1745969 RepID=A0AAD6WYI9_9AGAR|nr:hypothetical protein C8F04DRAFT_1237087 [Mycena alexandri]